MRFEDHLLSLEPLDAQRLLGQMEGMEMAMRICRARSDNLQKHDPLRSNEAGLIAELIRIVQVSIGNGTHVLDLSNDELDDIYRIS